MDAAYEVEWVSIQDNVPPHKSRRTLEYLDDLGWKILEQPPHSPDLNIIEYIWAWMKRKVAELMTKYVEDLMNILVIVWDTIDQNHIDNLVASMLRRQIIGHIYNQ